MIKRDLDAIQSHLQAGYDVEGIPRGETGEFAIRGGRSKHWLTTKYSTITYAGNICSQDAYVQAQFADFTGDVLKTQILCSFKNELEQSPELDIDTLNAKIIAFEASPEYAALKKGQGIATRLFSLKTDSIKAFEQIVE